MSSIQHDQKQADKAVNTLLRIARMALVYRWRMLLALLSAIAAACFQLMIPQILGRAVDNAYGLVAGALVPPDEVRQALWAAAGHRLPLVSRPRPPPAPARPKGGRGPHTRPRQREERAPS